MEGDVGREGKTGAADEAVIPTGRSIVVVIGINRYQNFEQLKNAVNDATGIEQLLVNNFGFEAPVPALLEESATGDAIKGLIRDTLRNDLEPDDSLILVFAGHAFTDENNTGYILPVDARRDRLSNYIKLDSFLDDVSKLPARHILVILDAIVSGIALGAQTFAGKVK